MQLAKPKLIILDIDNTLMVSRLVSAAMERYCRKHHGEGIPEKVREAIEARTTAEGGRVVHREPDGDVFVPLPREDESEPQKYKPSALIEQLFDHYDRKRLADDFDDDSPFSGDVRKGRLLEFADQIDYWAGRVKQEGGYYVPYDGAAEFVQRARAQGIKIAFVTSARGDYVIPELTRLGMYDPNHDMIVSRENGVEDATVKDRFFPGVMQHYEVEPSRTWFIGNDYEPYDALMLGATGIAYGKGTQADTWYDELKEKGTKPYKNDTDIIFDRTRYARAENFEQLGILLKNSREPERRWARTE